MKIVAKHLPKSLLKNVITQLPQLWVNKPRTIKLPANRFYKFVFWKFELSKKVQETFIDYVDEITVRNNFVIYL